MLQVSLNGHTSEQQNVLGEHDGACMRHSLWRRGDDGPSESPGYGQV